MGIVSRNDCIGVLPKHQRPRCSHRSLYSRILRSRPTAARRLNDTPSCGMRHVELIEHGLVEAIANTVGLRALGFGARMVDALDAR